MNAIAFPNLPLALQTPPQAVSTAEANSITQKLPGFVADFLALGLDLSPVRRLRKPLRPLWLTPASPLPDTPPSFTEFTPLVLVTASRMVKGAGIEGEYIQGAGDDHEGWAQESGLTPALFWRHHEKLLAARDDDELAELAGAICGGPRAVAGEGAAQQGGCTLVRPTEGVYVGAVGSGGLYDVVVNCCATAPLSHVAEAGCTVVPFPVPAGKKGIKALRAGLSDVVSAVEAGGGVGSGRKVAVVCESGDEVAPVVALVLLCLFYDDEGRFRRMAGEERARAVDKAYIRRRLAWIAASRPSANPARGALNVVNSLLMERPA